jgi:hypothetical protein
MGKREIISGEMKTASGEIELISGEDFSGKYERETK